MAWCGCCAKDDDSNLDLVASHKAGGGSAPGLSGGIGATVAARASSTEPEASPKESAAVRATSQAEPAAETPAEPLPAPPPVSEKKDVSDPPKAETTGPVSVVPGYRFPVSILKENRGMCVDINFHDGATLLLTKVNLGPVNDHNLANPSQALAPGDRVLAVNGVEGDTQAMLAECKSAPKLELEVQKCAEKTVTFAKKGGALDLGLEVSHVDCMTLIVTKVLPGGLVAEHNLALPEHDIRREDRIIAINGVRSHGAKLMELLKTEDSLELVVRRIWPDRIRTDQ